MFGRKGGGGRRQNSFCLGRTNMDFGDCPVWQSNFILSSLEAAGSDGQTALDLVTQASPSQRMVQESSSHWVREGNLKQPGNSPEQAGLSSWLTVVGQRPPEVPSNSNHPLIPWYREDQGHFWLAGNLPGPHRWSQGALAGSCWEEGRCGSGKAITAEAQGLCREASLSLGCPAAFPLGNNKPLRKSYREFTLSSVLLWDQQLDPLLLFSLNITLNHMSFSIQPLAPSSFTQLWGEMLFTCLSPVCQLSCQPTSAGTSPVAFNFFHKRLF